MESRRGGRGGGRGWRVDERKAGGGRRIAILDDEVAVGVEVGYIWAGGQVWRVCLPRARVLGIRVPLDDTSSWDLLDDTFSCKHSFLNEEAMFAGERVPLCCDHRADVLTISWTRYSVLTISRAA